jgi:DnaJ-domain-containing protein 1
LRQDGKLEALLLLCFAACLSYPAWADDAPFSKDADGVIRYAAPSQGDPRYRIVSDVPAGTKDAAPKAAPQTALREKSNIYSFKDENGVTHFSRLPHLDTRYKLLYRVPNTPTVESPSAAKSLQSAPLSQSPAATKPAQSAAILQSSSAAAQIESFSKSAATGGDAQADWNKYSFGAATPVTPEDGALGQAVLWLLVATLVAAIYALFRSSEPVKQTSASGLPPPGTPPDNDENARRSVDPVSRRNWWDVLGVAETAPLQDIRRTFREKISEYHPDKVASLGAEIRELAERKCKEINLAYRDALRANGVEK